MDFFLCSVMGRGENVDAFSVQLSASRYGHGCVNLNVDSHIAYVYVRRTNRISRRGEIDGQSLNNVLSTSFRSLLAINTKWKADFLFTNPIWSIVRARDALAICMSFSPNPKIWKVSIWHRFASSTSHTFTGTVAEPTHRMSKWKVPQQIWMIWISARPIVIDVVQTAGWTIAHNSVDDSIDGFALKWKFMVALHFENSNS